MSIEVAMENKPDPKKDKSGRILGSALFALYFTLFSFAFNVLSTITDGVSIGQALFNTVIGYFFFWYFCYAVAGIFDGLKDLANQPRSEDKRDQDQKSKKDDKNDTDAPRN